MKVGTIFVAMIATLALAMGSQANAATKPNAAAKPSAFVVGFLFCSSLDTRTLAMRFETRATKAAVSKQVARWYTWQIRNDRPAFRYPVRYQRIIAMGCARGLA